MYVSNPPIRYVIVLALVIGLTGFGIPVLQAKARQQECCIVDSHAAHEAAEARERAEKRARKEAEHAAHEAAEECERQQKAYRHAQHEAEEAREKFERKQAEPIAWQALDATFARHTTDEPHPPLTVSLWERTARSAG